MAPKSIQPAGKADSERPGLVVLLKRSEGVPMDEALRIAEEKGYRLASNKALSEILVGSEAWKGVRDAFGCWSGTLIGYDRAGKELGERIVYTDPKTYLKYIFPVPEEHRGKRDIALVAEHPDFTLVKEGNERIVLARKVDWIGGFPARYGESGWHVGDPRHDIPRGQEVAASHESARFMTREYAHVGLVPRINGRWLANLRAGFDISRLISGVSRPSYRLGVLAIRRQESEFDGYRSPPRTVLEAVEERRETEAGFWEKIKDALGLRTGLFPFRPE